MKKTTLSPYRLLAASLLLLALPRYPAAAQEKASARVKVTRPQAERIALAAVPHSTVQAVELEEEDGILRWSIDLRTPASDDVTEVGVDAVTGKIVEQRVETTQDEAKESDADKTKPRDENRSQPLTGEG